MVTGTPSSTLRPARSGLGDEASCLASQRQPRRGERGAARPTAQTPSSNTAVNNARLSGRAAPSGVGSGATLNRTHNQRPASTTATSSYQRYSVSVYESTTPNLNRFTVGSGASRARPTSIISQPEHGDSSYFVWARRRDRLAALQSPVRGHDYAAAGVVRSYHRVPSALRSEEDAISTQSPISSLTESDNASASVRWNNSAGALRHATHAVAPSIHSHAGNVVAASITTKREDSVAPISRYNRNTRPRTQSSPIVPFSPAANEQRPRTFLDMHNQYERTPTYRPHAQQVDWGSNLSPHSPGYTLQEIRQRRSTLSAGFPHPQNIVVEPRVFAGTFVDAPGYIGPSDARQVATRDVVKKEAQVKEEAEEKTPGKWRKVSDLFTKKLGRKGKDASPGQTSPHASPSTPHSTASLVESPPKQMAKSPAPTPTPAAPYTTRAREARPLSPLVVPPFALRPAGRVIATARDVQRLPVSPLSEADAHRGTEGLSPVSPLCEHDFSSNKRKPIYSLRPPPALPTPIQTKQQLLASLSAASALPHHRGQTFTSRHNKPTENAEESAEDSVPETLTLKQLDQDLFPSPLVVQKRWQRSRSPLSPSQQRHICVHQTAAADALVGENAHWVDAKAVKVVAKGKGRLVTNRQNSQQKQPPPERSRPVVLEAPGASESMANAREDGGDGKERRDTTFAGPEDMKGKEQGQEPKQQDEDGDGDGNSAAPSWRTNDSREFSPCVAATNGLGFAKW